MSSRKEDFCEFKNSLYLPWTVISRLLWVTNRMMSCPLHKENNIKNTKVKSFIWPLAWGSPCHSSQEFQVLPLYKVSLCLLHSLGGFVKYSANRNKKELMLICLRSQSVHFVITLTCEWGILCKRSWACWRVVKGWFGNRVLAGLPEEREDMALLENLGSVLPSTHMTPNNSLTQIPEAVLPSSDLCEHCTCTVHRIHTDQITSQKRKAIGLVQKDFQDPMSSLISP